MNDPVDNIEKPRRRLKRRLPREEEAPIRSLPSANPLGPAAPKNRDEVIDLIEYGLMALPLDQELKLVKELISRGLSVRAVADRLGYDRTQLLRLAASQEITAALKEGQALRRRTMEEQALDDSAELYAELVAIAKDEEVAPKVRRDAIKDVMSIAGIDKSSDSGITINVMQQQQTTDFNRRIDEIRHQQAIAAGKVIDLGPETE